MTDDRIEDRRLDEAADLRVCLARDAIAAFRVQDLSFPTCDSAGDPAIPQVTLEDVTAPRALAARHGFKGLGVPPEMMSTTSPCSPGGLAGFHRSKRQPLPGTQRLWEGVWFLSRAVIAFRAIQNWDESKSEGEEETDSSVLDWQAPGCLRLTPTRPPRLRP